MMGNSRAFGVRAVTYPFWRSLIADNLKARSIVPPKNT